MPTVLAALTRDDCINHIRYWRQRQQDATEERERQHATDRLDAWLGTLHDLTRLNPCD